MFVGRSSHNARLLQAIHHSPRHDQAVLNLAAGGMVPMPDIASKEMSASRRGKQIQRHAVGGHSPYQVGALEGIRIRVGTAVQVS